jgi:O-antigen ligase
MMLALKTVPTTICRKSAACYASLSRFFPALRLTGLASFLGLFVTLIGLASGLQLVVVVALLTVLAVAVVVLSAGIQGRQWAIALSFALITFTIDATFRRRADVASAGMDAQTAAKIVVWGGGLIIGLMNWSRLKRALQRSVPLRLMLAFAVWSLLSTLWSITPAYTFGGGFGMMALVCFVAVAVEGIGLEKLTLPIIYACGMLTLSAIALYIVMPSMAVALLEGGTTPRLAGLTGSPNNLGRTSAIALFFIFFAVRNKQVSPWRADIVGIALSALACLYLSWSRTALIAVMVAISLVLLRKRLLLLLWGAVAAFTALLLLLLANTNWDHLVRMVSRHGSIQELTTLTGRTAIWDFVWGSFLRQPLMGYGYGSTKLLIPMGFRTVYGWTTTSAHNMFLQSLVTTGMVGFLLVVALVVVQARDFVKRPHGLADAAFLFVLISGMTEAGAVGVAPNLLTIFWLVTLAVPREDKSVKGEG